MKYQFQSNPGEFSYKPILFTNAIKILVSVNFGIFVLQTLSNAEGLFFPLFGLVPRMVWSELMIWQPFTYLFFHGGIWHVLINMFVLWMFGSELERLWGKSHFLKFYFVTGVGSGLFTMLFNLQSLTPIVGASGAVYGVLLAYGLTYPNRQIYLYGIIPIKSIWFVIGIGMIAFMSSFNNISQVSHITHLSGMLIGYLMLKRPVQWRHLWFSIRKRTLEYRAVQEEKKATHRQKIEQDIDIILDKINREGFDSLSQKEQDSLYSGSRSLSRYKKKD
jgi:membrane associated rhomboid family serine protease